jgi:hypothetical protein
MNQLRDRLIETVHIYKPKNHLYKMYRTYYLQQNPNPDHFTDQEAKSLSLAFLRYSLRNNNETEIQDKTSIREYFKKFWTDWRSAVQMVLNIMAAVATIIGFASLTKTLTFFFTRKKDTKFASLQNSYYKSIGDHQFEKEDLDYTYASPLHDSNSIRSIIRPYEPKHKLDDDLRLETDKLLINDYEYVDNLYNEIKQIASEGLKKKKKSEKKDQEEHTVPSLVTVTSGEGLVKEIQEKGNEPTQPKKNTTTKRTATKKSVKTTTKKQPSASSTVGSGVKVFGSRNKQQL